jgi:hypothetical protein
MAGIEGCCEHNIGIWRLVMASCEQDIGTWRSFMGCCEKDLGTWQALRAVVNIILEHGG